MWRYGLLTCKYSVNISPGASGCRLISLVVQEVLSELKSMNTAKGEKKKIIFTASKKKWYPCCIQAVFGTCNSQLIKKEYQMGLLQLLFCRHCKGLLIYLCITQEKALSFTNLEHFGFRPFPKSSATFSELRTIGVLPEFAILHQTPANSHSFCLFWEPP